jgi:phosphoribosylanthranilate isomerase
MVHVKICGVMDEATALACVEAGASAIGLNFVPSSPRCLSYERAKRIAEAVGPRAQVVGVVADLDAIAMQRLREETGVLCLQLHGNEPNDALVPLLPHAYKAVRIADRADVALAEAYAGDYLLVDAKVDGALGGTGATFDWRLVEALARKRKLTLAGGLHPDNVAEAIACVRPYCVDVASGVEAKGAPGVKDMAKVRAFIAACRDASA